MKNEFLSPQHKKYVQKLKIRKIAILSAQAGVLLFFLILWEVLSSIGVIDPFLMSSPSRIWKTLADLYLDGQLFYHLWIS